jgi:hypothetical protein
LSGWYSRLCGPGAFPGDPEGCRLSPQERCLENRGRTVYDDVPVFASAEEALRDIECDALVDYTHPPVVKKNLLPAIERGVR